MTVEVSIGKDDLQKGFFCDVHCFYSCVCVCK